MILTLTLTLTSLTLTPDLWPCRCLKHYCLSNDQGKKAVQWSAAVPTCFNGLLRLYKSELASFRSSCIFFFYPPLFILLPQLWLPLLLKWNEPGSWHFAFWAAGFSPHVQLFMLNSSLPTAMEATTYTYTHTQLCKRMCHVLAVIFLGLCFAKENWQLQYREQCTSERLLLEMKAMRFYFS